MSEVWKDIPGYERRYQVSNIGNVRSLDYMHTGKTVLLKPATGKNKRVTVRLYIEGVSKTINIETLVARAFIGERPEGYQVCHKDGNSLNNTLSNLRYDTGTQNTIDKYRYGGKHGKSVLTTMEVCYIRALYKTGKFTHRKLAKMFGVYHSNITYIVNRKTYSWLNDDGTIQESNTAVS